MSLRVFVNEKPVTVARGATVRDAVAALDGDLAGLLASGAAYATDGVGRPVDASDPVGEGGAIFRVVVTARQGPPRLSKDLLRRWPKAELHVHLDGCLRPQTMLDLARSQGIRLPADTPEALARALSVQGSRSLEEYLAKYEITLSVMQTAQALERIAYEFVVEASAAPATPARGTGPIPSTRRCTTAARSASATAHGSARTPGCSKPSWSERSRSRCASSATCTPARWRPWRSIRSSATSSAACASRSTPTVA